MHKRGRLGTYEDLPPLLVDDDPASGCGARDRRIISIKIVGLERQNEVGSFRHGDDRVDDDQDGVGGGRSDYLVMLKGNGRKDLLVRHYNSGRNYLGDT